MNQEKQKLNFTYTMVLGTGFMVISMAWMLFNSYVPIFMRTFISSSFLISIVMVLDNLAGMTIQPLISSLSDRTWTKHGRRMPFLMLGIPLASVFFLLLPLNFTLFTTMVSVVLFDLSMSIFRGPTVALMPDLTPSNLRSKANGIINFMGGIGSIIALFVGSYLYEMNHLLPFVMTSVIMVGVLFLLKATIKEPQPEKVEKGLHDSDAVVIITKEAEMVEKEPKESLFKSIMKVFKDEDKSCMFLLFAILCWFIGWNGIETWFTTYGKFVLDISESAASRLMTWFSLTFLLAAIPSGFIATKFGRKRTILTGVIGMIAVVILLFTFRSPSLIKIIFLFGGLSWALININSYPMVVEMSRGNIGTYTGLYYFFSSTAAIFGPMICGLLMDLFGFSMIFIVGAISLVLALYFLLKVKAGEVNTAQSVGGDTIKA